MTAEYENFLNNHEDRFQFYGKGSKESTRKNNNTTFWGRPKNLWKTISIYMRQKLSGHKDGLIDFFIKFAFRNQK